MKQQALNSGIIFTNDECIGCNKCISGCISLGANVVVAQEDSDEYRVEVDPNKCVLCGHCIESCVHKARTYRDDTDDFFAALERGEKISILVAPSLLIDYEKQYNSILGYLKGSGVQHIYNTSFGADIMVWVYMNFIYDYGLTGAISQFCPVIINYLEKYKPALLDYLVPVQSPMMCTAIYVSDYLNISDKLAYISPCIAEKYEIDDVNTYGKVTYNVTFERLMERIGQTDISGCYAEDEVSYGLGALMSSAGGLSDNVRPYIGFNKVLIQTSGYSNIFPYFDNYYEGLSDKAELPFLVDVLSCTNGCNFGTGTNYGVEHRNEVTFSAYRVKEKAYKSGNVPKALDYKERLSLLNQHFKAFELSSFVRQYDNVSGIKPPEFAEDTIDEIFETMYKTTDTYRHTDCGACGYKTCRDMACAIGMNVNHKENCINYSKHRIRLEKEKTSGLLTEISHMNEELRKSAQLKSNFLANMSHEIRTPMNAVIGMAELALRGDLPGEERGYIQQIKASGHSLLTIINDILDFSKIESGKMEINETDYTVMSILNDTVHTVMTRIGEKNITLIVDADPDIPFMLHGDDIRIKQVLVNFANNAVKFASSGFVEIKMWCELCDGVNFLSVSVRDTGIGIKPEDLSKLFNSFQQVDSTRNRNIEGTGLGLAISREFVRLMNGSINVESTYGIGSTFSFRIPQTIVDATPSVSVERRKNIKIASFITGNFVRDGFLRAIKKFSVDNTECDSIESLRAAVENGAEFIFIECSHWNAELDAFVHPLTQVQTVVIVNPGKDIVAETYVRKLNMPIYSLNVAAVLNRETQSALGNRSNAEVFRFEAPDAKILIVDDNAVNLTVAQGLLSPLHMNIDVAFGAREAFGMIEKNRYDIVLMDHMMPDIDGIEATHMLREKEGEYYRKLPIIALTANAINNAKEMFLREGMNDFIAKPIEIADIAAKIKRWLPAAKVKNAEESGAFATQPEDELPDIPGIDVRAGVAHAGTPELYKKILEVYYASIEKKSDLIEKHEAEGNIQAYTIEVHALKSSARLIGATELSELAARLEKCGHAGETQPIKAETAELLRFYREQLALLAPYCHVGEEIVESETTPEQLSESLTALFEALDDFNINTARELMDELKRYKLDEQESELRERLCDAVDSVEYDEASELVQEWLDRVNAAG